MSERICLDDFRVSIDEGLDLSIGFLVRLERDHRDDAWELSSVLYPTNLVARPNAGCENTFMTNVTQRDSEHWTLWLQRRLDDDHYLWDRMQSEAEAELERRELNAALNEQERRFEAARNGDFAASAR